MVAADTPLAGGLDTIKHADDAAGRGGAASGSDCRARTVPVLRRRIDPRQPGAGPGGRLARPEVVVARRLHRSLLLGLVLAGLKPVWMEPDGEPGSGLPPAVPVGTVRGPARHPDACAVFLGDPSYVGATGDLGGHPQPRTGGCPARRGRRLGGALGFHPGLPPHAMAAGADAMVTSAHKTLPAYSQGALVLARTELLGPSRLARAFEALHTTSPAGTIIASIDAARALLDRDGSRLVARLLRLVAGARRGWRRSRGRGAGGAGRGADQAHRVLAGTGAHGEEVEADLMAAGMPVEMADRDTIVPVVTLADDAAPWPGSPGAGRP